MNFRERYWTILIENIILVTVYINIFIIQLVLSTEKETETIYSFQLYVNKNIYWEVVVLNKGNSSFGCFCVLRWY